MLIVNKWFYKSLQLVMLVISIHWVLATLLGFSTMSLFGLSVLVGLLCLFVRQSWLKRVYGFLIRHKGLLLILSILFQMLLLLSAKLLIRSDAAVVFKGAFKELPLLSISSYLTRNPNNIPLFLYERFFYQVFGQEGLWVLQALNMLCLNSTAYILYRIGKDFFSQRVADLTFFAYVFLLGFSPYVMAMYTDILGLPFLSLSLYCALRLVTDKQVGWQMAVVTGVLTAFALLWRSTAVITIVALLMVLFLKGNYRSFLKMALLVVLSLSVTYGSLAMGVARQNQVPIIEGEGLAKPVLNFVNLGLTYSGTDQKDMKDGLLQYLPKKERQKYNNGMFKQEYVIKEIKRRWANYTYLGFTEHLIFKQAETVNDGTLGWLYQDPDKEKTAYLSPLYQTLGERSWATWIREQFIERDSEIYHRFASVKQGIWLLLAIGLCLASGIATQRQKVNFLMLATFGGLLFLLIFEGGKGRYLIQFLPQILLLSAVGWDKYCQKGNKT